MTSFSIVLLLVSNRIDSPNCLTALKLPVIFLNGFSNLGIDSSVKGIRDNLLCIVDITGFAPIKGLGCSNFAAFSAKTFEHLQIYLKE